MRIQIDVAFDTVCARVLSFEEFACLFGASHGDQFSFLPLDVVVAIIGVCKHERQGIATVDWASEVLARQLNRLGIHVDYKPASSLPTTLSRIKEPIPKIQQTNVIYRIPCANCSCVYIGHTSRRLGTRINEHKLAVRGQDPLYLVFAHALECDNQFNWDETEVVTMANTKGAREFLEAWYSCAGSIYHNVNLDIHYEGLRLRLTAPV
ncbi:unnamed protein product [Schistocephalus solidus]|uniref:GIY-YIG domain-containing protein n=1 Tax=Schistocephalus solidus TaxID=70667 RepID=A0A183SAH6_SCHSO|nr:unnamed protein product [Schistocephalus solidus]